MSAASGERVVLVGFANDTHYNSVFCGRLKDQKDLGYISGLKRPEMSVNRKVNECGVCL